MSINSDVAYMLINAGAIVQGIYDYIHMITINMSVLSSCLIMFNR